MSKEAKTAPIRATPHRPSRATLLGAAASVAVLAFGAWYALRSGADGQALAAEADARTTAPTGVAAVDSSAADPPAAVGRAAAAAPATGVLCTNPWFPQVVGAERNYRMNTGRGDGTLRLSLTGLRNEGRETRATWRAQVTQPDGVASDASSVRSCEGELAQEPWYGWGIESLIRFANQSWRYPQVLRTGLSFGGTIDLLLVSQRHTVSRQHRVTGRERITTAAGTFEAWRIDYEDHAAATLSGTYWLAEGPGMVRATQDNGTGETVYELTQWSNP